MLDQDLNSIIQNQKEKEQNDYYQSRGKRGYHNAHFGAQRGRYQPHGRGGYNSKGSKRQKIDEGVEKEIQEPEGQGEGEDQNEGEGQNPNKYIKGFKGGYKGKNYIPNYQQYRKQQKITMNYYNQMMQDPYMYSYPYAYQYPPQPYPPQQFKNKKVDFRKKKQKEGRENDNNEGENGAEQQS